MEPNFSVECKGGVVKIELVGRLDATNTPALQLELQKLAGQAEAVTSLVFLAKELEYISSAGLRIIIFAKQKLGANAQVYLIGAQDAVLSVVKMSGLDNFMHIQDAFDE